MPARAVGATTGELLAQREHCSKAISRDACGIAASLSRLFEVGTVARNECVLSFLKGGPGMTADELLAMPAALRFEI